jgi:hypothetical protein
MKRKVVLVAATVVALALPAAANAAPGGAPAAHGLPGAEWGAAASGLAQSAPGAVADHIRSQRQADTNGDLGGRSLAPA